MHPRFPTEDTSPPRRSPNPLAAKTTACRSCQRVALLVGRKRAGQSRGGPRVAAPLSAGRRGNGLLQLLAADLAGAGLQEQVVAGVAHQHRVVQLLVWDGQLQVTTVFTEHITTVPVRKQKDFYININIILS